ncbi:hypothetical protein, partial [Denitromonas iodatirespirans]|uniref:hypothetical protein n=1 Tax=Denitromonas iodatirespirans TaxID=2795389 RepID=UPI001BDDC5B4
TSTGSAYLGSHDLNCSNRPVRTRMPGGVGGDRSEYLTAPIPIRPSDILPHPVANAPHGTDAAPGGFVLRRVRRSPRPATFFTVVLHAQRKIPVET